MATTIKNTQSISKINSILAKGGDIVFSKGTYNITSTLIICSNSNITCEPGVIFNRSAAKPILITKYSTSTTKFTGAKNITWNGGQFVGNKNSTDGNMIVFFHANNVIFKNAVLDKCVGTHFIEINGSKDITISECAFNNHITKTGKEHKESIQIDFANYDGLPYDTKTSKCFDGTHCRSITISKCKFNNCTNGIGTHTITTEDKYHKDIIIEDCKFVGTGESKTGVGIKLLNMRDVTIKDCDLSCFETEVLINRTITGHLNNGGTKKLTAYKDCRGVSIINNKYSICLK